MTRSTRSAVAYYRSRVSAFSAVCVLALALPASTPAAGDAPGVADTVEIEALVTTIEDPAQREVFVAQLKALVEANREAARDESSPASTGAAVLEVLSSKVSALSSRLFDASRLLLDAPRLVTEFASRSEEAGQSWRAFWSTMLIKVVGVIAAGFLGELVSRRLLSRSMESFGATPRERAVARIPAAAGRTILDLVCVAAFGVGAYAALAVVEPREMTRLVGLALINANVIARIPLAVARALLTPRVPELRLVPIGDETANYWYIWARRLVGVLVYGYFTVEVLLLLGIGLALHALLLDLLALIVVMMVVVLVHQNRLDGAALIRGDGSATGPLAIVRRHIADFWHVFATIYAISVFLAWLLHVPGGFAFIARATALSALIVGIAAAFSVVVRRALSRLTRLRPETSARFPGLEARSNRYLPAVNAAISLIVFVIAAIALLGAWNVDAFGWVNSDAGRALGARAATITFIIVSALVVWELMSAAIGRYLNDPDNVGRSARARTLLPLARNAMTVVMSIIVVLTVFSEVGIDIAPLLAGAGVLGLAIGFGAQTLVKDIITGVFILIEDTIAIGDYIEVGSHSGTVESISIRTIKLRDPAGNVHTVPFSEVASVLNYTKDFSFAVIDVGVAYRENVDDVIEVIKSIGEGMLGDETLAPNIIEPIEVLGLHELADSAVIIRARIKTTPGKQWSMRRAFNLRMKRRFDELGIEIPFPHQTIYFGEDKEGRAPPIHVARPEV